MKLRLKKAVAEEGTYGLDIFQRIALGGMFALTLLTFIGANFHAFLWQSSDWLVSTVLPAVVVKLTNEERAGLSEAPLRRSAVLDQAAQMKANHMARNQYFSHYAPDGTSPWYWFDQSGYVYAHAGENLAIHFSDSSEVVDAWMDSPTHRANIVGSQYTEIGVGTARGEYDGYETVYVVQLFGTPAQAAAPKPAPPPAQVAAATPAPTPVAAAPVPEAAPVPIPTPADVAEEASEGDEAVLAAETPVESKEETEVASNTDIASSTPTSTPAVTTVAPVAATLAKPGSKALPLPEMRESMIATSSGLIALIQNSSSTEDHVPVAGVVTRPSAMLQIVYTLFGFIVIGLLAASVVLEARKTHYIQAVYGIGLLAVMAGLWFIHTLLTSGAVVT